jgi:hypothetical protein
MVKDSFTSSLDLRDNPERSKHSFRVAKSTSDALPLFHFRFQFRSSLLESLNMVELPLSRVTSCKSIARTLQSHLVGWVNRDGGKWTLSTTWL